jgi:putative acetyltransferase
MGIRMETDWDHDAVHRLHTSAFGRRAEAELVDELRKTDTFLPRLSLVAEQNSVIIGHILFTHVTLESDPPSTVLSLAPMAVFPAFQNRGVGSALVRAGLARAEEMGEPLVVVLGHAGYYPRFGFVPARPMGIEPPWADTPDENFLVKPLSGYREDMRGRVSYPPVFDSV